MHIILGFKGTVSQDFLLQVFFLESTSPQASKNNIRVILNFFENSRRYSQVKVHHRYQRHRRKILPPVQLVLLIPVANNGNNIGCRHLKVNLKAKIYTYVNSTYQRCPNKIIKTLLIEDFFYLPLVSTTPVVHLELRICLRIFEKI